ncbi:MAG: endonuclease MutS2 [Saprospiraceae bacterium]|nr:endonuclease MutS2 [Saprospiraceae bacterium]
MSSIYPKDLYQQLEFDQILIDLSRRCIGAPAQARCLLLPLLIDKEAIDLAIAQVESYLRFTEAQKRLRVQSYQPMDEAFRWLEIEESVLPIESIISLRDQMNMIVAWRKVFDDEMNQTYLPIYQILEQTEPLPALLASIERIFDEEGEVRNNASTELSRLRKQIQSRTSALDHAFNQSMSHYRNQGFLADNLESHRSGRRVMAVLAEYKRKVKGIILDESSSGRTVFIEPQEAIALDNEISELKNEERREIRRILKELTREMSVHLEQLKSHFQVIVEVDILQAKTAQAKVLGAQAPSVKDVPGLQLSEAKHPLLLLKHPKEQEKVIPFDLSLNQEQRITLISGPNAGGKTITLKTVGLLTLMLQSGLLIPASSESRLGIFRFVFADIGDQQSLENDLSTYHSHLNNMRELTTNADPSTLFLIDEFGSGTEPAAGGAIAESILNMLQKKKALGVITSHYRNLKIFASNHPAIQNASMAFDKQALRPTFQLRQGTPGSSFAFEMAHRSGLHKDIINQARNKLGRKAGRLEYLLTSLENEKHVVDKKVKKLAQKEADLEKLIKSYDRMQLELEVKRKRLKLQEKTQKLQEETRANKKLEKIIRQIREKEKLEDAKVLAASLKKSKKALEERVVELKEEINGSNTQNYSNRPLQVGDYAKMKSGDTNGKIDRIDKDKATLIVGNLRLDVNLNDLTHSRAPIDLHNTRSIKTHIAAADEVFRKLDIRGLRRDQALQRLEKFIDKALVANLGSVEIIHGKGNGTLRNLVKEKLREYSHSFHAYHPEPNRGGEGVTLVDLQGLGT